MECIDGVGVQANNIHEFKTTLKKSDTETRHHRVAQILMMEIIK